MTKEQFKQLKVGDVVEYNDATLLKGCQFKITELLSSMARGIVVKNGTGGSMVNSYEVGCGLAGLINDLTLVSQNDDKSEPFATLELSVQEAAVLYRLLRSVWGNPSDSIRKFTNSINTKLYRKFPTDNCLDGARMFNFNNIIEANFTVERLDSELVRIGLLKAPEKPKAAARHKIKGPDGKWAPKNYRVITYPEHGTGKPVKRHVLWGDFVKGTAGANVHVEEWCADSKKWCPKTYSLGKVGVVE